MIKTTRFIYCDNCGKEIENVKNTATYNQTAATVVHSGIGRTIYGINRDFLFNIHIDRIEITGGQPVAISERVDLCETCRFSLLENITDTFNQRNEALNAIGNKEEKI